MNQMITVVSLGAFVLIVGSLSACEGEPPANVPENPLRAAPSPSLAPVALTEPPAPAQLATTVCPPPPCAPVPSAAVAPVASAASETAGAPSSSPEATVRGDITGVVTTKPAWTASSAVVYLEDGPKDDAPAGLQTVTVENRQMTFAPSIAVVGVGGTVVFANLDPFPHNVFSPDNEKFNMGNIPQNGARRRVFDKPGTYSLLCNLHPGMLGYLIVTPTTHYAKTDAKGRFTMKHVPEGTYRVTAWAPRQTPSTQSVTVASGEVVTHFDLQR